MNRKFVFGCLGLAGLVAVAGQLFLYVNVLRPTREIMGDLRQLGELSEMNARVVETAPFAPPADGSLSADQLERFAGVQTAMRLGLGPDFVALERRAEKLRGLNRGDDGSVVKPGFREVIEAFKGLGPLLERAKVAQVDALNEAGFSYAEYRWVRESTYAALGKDNADVYLEEFAEAVLGLGDADEKQEGAAPGDSAPGEGAGSAGRDPVRDITPITASDSPRNRILAAAYGDSLSLWEPFLVFGL